MNHRVEKYVPKSGIAIVAMTIFLSLFSSLHISSVNAQDVAYRNAMAEAVRAAAGQVLPSIVTIEIVGAESGGQGEVEQDAPTSGVVVDSDGFILASSIVVRRTAASILVVLPDGSRHAAEVISRDHHRDLALLKIESSQPLDAIELPDELDLRIGRTAVAVGRYGREGSPMVSTGVLSAIDRLDGVALQTDARVSPTFYGGPLVDLYGNVLGVLIPAVAEGGAPDATSWYDSGIAFAIPSNIIRQKIDRLKEGQDIKKGLIGIVAKAEDPYENNTVLAAVRTRSPAEDAGLKPGDRVVSVAGKMVRRHQEIKQVLGKYDAGESIEIEFERDGDTQRVEITLTDSIPPLQPQRIGIAVIQQPSDDENASSVVVDAVVSGTPSDGLLELGDVIKSFAGAEITDTQTLRRQLISAEPDVAIKLKISREDSDLEIEIDPESIDGPVMADLPKGWIGTTEETWKVSELKLPDAPNVAAIVAPEVDSDAESESTTVSGLLVLLQGTGQAAPQEELKKWAEIAEEHNVVICAVASNDTKRWQAKEIDIVSRFASAAMKKADIDKQSVAVAAHGALTGHDSEASDSMALAVALSASESFRGVAVSEKTKAPAVRLRENDAAASLQILLPIESRDGAPPWASALRSAGYPIVQGGSVDKAVLLRWVRLLQTI